MLKQKSRLQTKSSIDLTPMVDVVFLLIIFFMTSSTLVKIKALKVDLPQAAATQNEIQDQITVSISAQGVLYLNGQEIAAASLQESLEKLTAGRTDTVVTIEGDKNVSYQEIVSLMSVAKNAGVARVSLAARVP